MWTIIAILGLASLQRLLEFYIAHRNTKRLLASGGVELGSGHYLFIVALHVLWLAGLWYFAWGREVAWPWVLTYLVLEAARGWIIAALGGRWTTRIIAMPGEAVPETGPSRFFRQPNYLVVAAEVFILPMAFGLWLFALCFGLVNAALLYWRLQAEDKALDVLR